MEDLVVPDHLQRCDSHGHGHDVHSNSVRDVKAAVLQQDAGRLADGEFFVLVISFVGFCPICARDSEFKSFEIRQRFHVTIKSSLKRLRAFQAL